MIPIDQKDPEREKKKSYVEGVNRVGDLINSVQRDMEDKLLLVLSILFSSLIGWFISKEMYVLAIVTFGILFIGWIITFIKESKDKEKLSKKLNNIVKEAREKTGLDLSNYFD